MTDSPTNQASDFDESQSGLTSGNSVGRDVSVDAPDVAAVLGGQVRQRDDLSQTRASARIDGVVVGRVVNCSGVDDIHVDFPLNPTGGTIAARSTVPVTDADVGREVALLFEGADPSKPIIMGFMQQVLESPIALETQHGTQPIQVDVTGDGKRMTLSADDQITIRCGESSITLTRAGKILLKGKYLSSHAAGVNRIRGGSVQLN